MGVRELSKKLRPNDETPDVFSTSKLLSGKTIGIDFSVVCHKSVATEVGAGEFFVDPPVPNSEVISKCTRLCSYAKANSIALKISVDGRYHPGKENENSKRRNDRQTAKTEAEAMFKLPNINERTKDALKLMKKAAHVTPDILAAGIKVFNDHGHEVFGAPYESDFQLVHWENIGFTDGTYSTDSDIFALGSSLVVDLLNFNSATGKCKILERKKVLGRIAEGSDSWMTEDVLLFAALSGCDFIKRLFRLDMKSIEATMAKWKDPSHAETLESLLSELSKDRHWPGGNHKPGARATDYVERVKRCMGLMLHAPVTDFRDGQWEIVPLRPLEEGKQWCDVIGFDPVELFDTVSVEDSYNMKVWARSGIPLPTQIPLPMDPNNSSRTLPYAAHVRYDYTPACVVPVTVLRQWLHFRGVPIPKGTAKKDVVEQVNRALDLQQPLDEERISSTDATTANSYVSVDCITVLKEVLWVTDGNTIVDTVRKTFPKIDTEYIDSIFGLGKNGIRERAWLRFESGHLNMETLRSSKTKVKVRGVDEEVQILEMKITPSMKNVVYSVYIVVNSSGVYLDKLSKCDCPNGWLFCSHTLACFLLLFLIQEKSDWSFVDIVEFMPVPIKSLQSVPLAASYVFGELKISKPGTRLGEKKNDDEYNRKIAKSIATDVPGYAGKYKIDDEDATEETRLMQDELGTKKEVKSVDLCKRLENKVRAEENEKNRRKTTAAKVTMHSITSYNDGLVKHCETNKNTLRKLIRHERLYRMMVDGAISKDSALWYHLHHFAADRAQKIETLKAEVSESDRLATKTELYDVEYLKEYFKGDEDDNNTS